MADCHDYVGPLSPLPAVLVHCCLQLRKASLQSSCSANLLDEEPRLGGEEEAEVHVDELNGASIPQGLLHSWDSGQTGQWTVGASVSLHLGWHVVSWGH